MAEVSVSGIMIGSSQPEVLSDFYTQVFDRPPDMKDGGWSGWKSGDSWLSIGEHSEVQGGAVEPQRVIINMEAQQVQEEFERLRDAGAAVIKEPYELQGVWIATLADPDGNYFQLMSPWVPEQTT